ncbi:MAG: hypothetical protein LBJ62_09810 [Bifidobacteriaceae bacterium]|jgi:hypothetical protein|nr:hypothetical protein [Bifidobacteriaceae bacterium]
MLNRPSPGTMIDRARSLGQDGQTEEAGLGLLKAYPAQVEVALIDYDSRQATNYLDRLLAIQRDVEQNFLDENRDQLDKMAAAAHG